jgi:hypothetical protein
MMFFEKRTSLGVYSWFKDHCKIKRNMKLLVNIIFILFLGRAWAQPGESAKQDLLSLKGKWKFAVDLNDEGLHKKWYLGNLVDTYLGNVLYKPLPGMSNQFVTTFNDEIDIPGTTDIAG